MSLQAKFIVFEGGEGCGKDVNIGYLQELFADRDDIVFTREPGGTEIGEQVRSILMDTAHKNMCVETELLLFLASRAQLLEEVVRPALAAGKHVISNRFALSTVAYQIYRKNRHEYRDFLDAVSQRLMGDVAPLYILLDVEPETGLARARGRDDTSTRFDLETLETHKKVQVGYKEAIQTFPHVIIDANQPLRTVRSEIEKYVTNLLNV